MTMIDTYQKSTYLDGFYNIVPFSAPIQEWITILLRSEIQNLELRLYYVTAEFLRNQSVF